MYIEFWATVLQCRKSGNSLMRLLLCPAILLFLQFVATRATACGATLLNAALAILLMLVFFL